MTIQVAVMNGYGVAMASDRHVYRGGEMRSTGQDTKLLRLRGPIPAAMMAAGPFAMFGTPVSRLALRLENALAACREAGPEPLAAAILQAVDAPLGMACGDDKDLLAEVAHRVITRAEGPDGTQLGLERVMAELDGAPLCRDGATIEAQGHAAWAEAAPALARSSGPVADGLRHAPELYGRAVARALARRWRGERDLYLTVGMVCPATGVPAMVALRLWRGLGGRLYAVSRLDAEYEVSWRAGRTVVAAQGSGRALVEAMIDGLGEDHWHGMDPRERERLRPALDGRWSRAHTRLGVSSPRELGSVAAALVRGAEAVGFLTRDGESTLLDVDCLCLTPREVIERPLAA